MRLSYFPYDFWECCCEAVNAAVCVGTFRCVSAVLIAVYSTACPGAACCVRPGCSMCPWAAARPLAVRATSSARRVVSKPGQAPPPPTSTAARPSNRPQAPQPGHTTTRGHHSRTQQPFTGFVPRSCRDRIRGLLDSGRDNAPMTRHPCMKRTTPPSTLPRSRLKPPAPLSAPPRSRLKPLAPPSAPPRPEPQPLAPLSILPSTRLKPLPPPSTLPRPRLKPLAPPSAPPRPETQPLAPLLMLPSTRLKPLPPPSTMYGRFLVVFRR